MKFIGIIPARYASTRFPGKPLADLAGKPMIQRVYEQVQNVLDSVCVATDDNRIEAAVQAFGGNVIMTSDQHKSGTDRCYEAYCKIGDGYDVVVNIQGDEPFIQPEQIEILKACFIDDSIQIATLVKPFRPDDDFETTLFNANSPKVVLNKKNEAMYFSRSIIPYMRGRKYTEWLPNHTYYKHIGLYAYRADTLKEITHLPQSPLELAESLEQLRWLENGYKIKVGITQQETIGIDTPEDMEKALAFLNFSTATVILPLLFLSFQLGLLSFLGFFQTFHETRLLHRLFLVFFQLGQQLIFVNRITENYSLQNRDQCGDEVIVGQTGCILIEEYQHHQRHHVHHRLHSRHLLLSSVRLIHIELRIYDVRYGHQQTEQTDMISEVRCNNRNICIPAYNRIISRQVVCPKETLVTQFYSRRKEHEQSDQDRHL